MNFWLVTDMLKVSQETSEPKIRREKENNIASLHKTFHCFTSPSVCRKQNECIPWTDPHLGCACRVRQPFPARFAPNLYPVHLPVVAETTESSFMGCLHKHSLHLTVMDLNPVVPAWKFRLMHIQMFFWKFSSKKLSGMSFPWYIKLL